MEDAGLHSWQPPRASLIFSVVTGIMSRKSRVEKNLGIFVDMTFDSPLRYPGGKASLAAFLSQTIEINSLSGCSYFEPFAGGAGAALRLLREGIVSEVYLNDLDHRITSFWRSVVNESERFANAIRSVPINISEWKRQQAICRLGDATDSFELGFATFYLNRCNRSGIVLGAAPIGGYAQVGEWKMDARFYRETLAERVLAIGGLREQIHVTNMDALKFLGTHLAHNQEQRRTFTYLDPPYHSNGNRLYMNSYHDQDHRELATFMQGQGNLNWIMSYDDTAFIRNLYSDCEISALSLEYSLQRRRKAQELLISPTHVLQPLS